MLEERNGRGNWLSSICLPSAPWNRDHHYSAELGKPSSHFDIHVDLDESAYLRLGHGLVQLAATTTGTEDRTREYDVAEEVCDVHHAGKGGHQ